MAVRGKFTENLHPRGHGGKFIRGLPRLQTKRDRDRAISTLARFRHHVLTPQTASVYHAQHGPAVEHRPAVAHYLGGGYRDVNAAMREGRDHPDVDALAAAFRPLQHDLVVSRRVDPAAFGLDSPDGLRGLVGKKVADAAYQTASLHDETGRDGVTMHIAVPKGVPAVASEDGQIILDRDTELAIVGAAPNTSGGWDVHAVLLKKPVPRGAKTGEPHVGADLSKLTVAQLQAKVREQGRRPGRMRKAELIAALQGDGGKAAHADVIAAPKAGASPAPKPATEAPAAQVERVHAALHRMINADTIAEAEQIAATLKGKDLDVAIASTPLAKSTLARDTAASKRRQLVRWATSADTRNGDAIRRQTGVTGAADPEIDRASRRAEIKVPEAATKPVKLGPNAAIEKPRAGRSAPSKSNRKLPAATMARVSAALDEQIAAIGKAGGNPGPFERLREQAKTGTLSEQAIRDVVNSLVITRQAARIDNPGPLSSSEQAEAEAGRAVIAALSEPAATGNKALSAAPRSIMRPDELTRDQRQFLGYYKGTAFDNVNGLLRREQGAIPEGDPDGPLGFYHDITGAIDSVMAQSKLTSDVAVLRGVANAQEAFGEAFARDLTGAEWVEHAYVSTSADPTISRLFAGRTTAGAMLRIRVPKGTEAVQLSGDEYGSELLLQRGLRFRIVGDTGPLTQDPGKAGPVRILDVEVIP